MRLKEISLAVVLGFLILLEAIGAFPTQALVHPAIKQIPFLELIEGLQPETNKKEKDNFVLLPEENMGQPIVLASAKNFKPRNVVLIIFESLSWKYCDVYKPGLEATPFLAELAKKSLVVERLYTVDPHTTKALMSIIGGIYPYPEPEVVEVKPGILPRKSLAHLLQRAGYKTAFFQTANDYESRPELVSNLGYETFRGLYHMSREGFAYVNYFGYEEMMMLQPSMQWVDENKNQPFFLTYLTLSTRHEYGYPPSFPARDFGLDNENQNRYLNAVRYTDFFIKKVFEEFKKRGLIENTIFIIVGDHGEAFGEHGSTGHNYSLWEEGIRVPGIIYAPGIFKKPGKIEGFWSILDIAPTICDLLGLEVTEGEFTGRSWLRPADENRELFLTGWTRSRVMAYRQGRYKFIFKYWERKPEIYDNLADEEDRNDLWAVRPELVSQAEAVRKKLERKWESIAFQYRQWAEEAQNKSRLEKSEDFACRLEASFENLISIYGYGYFPEKTEPGRKVYLKVGINSLNKLKRPWKLQAVIFSAQTGRRVEFSLRPRKDLHRLKAGEYTSAESILTIPADWPTGISGLFLGMLDEKRNKYLRPEGDSIERISGFEHLVYAGDLYVFPADD
uniref:sulfatase-like hydrolase/transferase n=1 Tax=Candidatus Saccharicenans sp. TaxID=2819258 RepID=UPI00404A4720